MTETRVKRLISVLNMRGSHNDGYIETRPVSANFARSYYVAEWTGHYSRPMVARAVEFAQAVMVEVD